MFCPTCRAALQNGQSQCYACGTVVHLPGPPPAPYPPTPGALYPVQPGPYGQPQYGGPMPPPGQPMPPPRRVRINASQRVKALRSNTGATIFGISVCTLTAIAIGLRALGFGVRLQDDANRQQQAQSRAADARRLMNESLSRLQTPQVSRSQTPHNPLQQNLSAPQFGGAAPGSAQAFSGGSSMPGRFSQPGMPTSPTFARDRSFARDRVHQQLEEMRRRMDQTHERMQQTSRRANRFGDPGGFGPGVMGSMGPGTSTWPGGMSGPHVPGASRPGEIPAPAGMGLGSGAP